jgi:hypothetical protein
MRLERRAERLMGMTDAIWLRHANPWSGWTRLTILPLWALVVWSRVWIGWGAWIGVALVLAWIWFNPRVFPVPGHFDAWMTRGLLGERVYLEHHSALPAHHRRVALILSFGNVPGLAVMIWGLWVLDVQATVFGVAAAMVPKLWFVDRMVWILQDWRQAGGSVPGLPEGEGDV